MATITFRLNRPKEKTGELKLTPVSIQVELYVTKAKRPTVSTGEEITPTHWNQDKQRAKATFKNHTELNLHLGQIQQDLLQLWRDNKSVSKEQLIFLMKEYLRGESVQKKNLLQALDSLILQYSNEKDKKTTQKFIGLKNHLTNYAKTHPLNFESLDFGFYDQFKNFLYAQPNPQYKGMYLHNQGTFWAMNKTKSSYPVGLMDDTVYKYIINFKIFLTWAGKRGYTIVKGYEDWPIIQREYEPISLTMDELQRIEALTITPHTIIEKLGVDKCYLPKKAGIIAEALSNAKDYLALECRTAQRISDLQAFHLKDVSQFKWTFIQNKGRRLKSKQVTVPFVGYCAPAYMILQKHNFQLPKISVQKLNDNIKNVCKIAGLTQEIYTERWAGNKKIRIIGPKYEFISTHTGRKTFITLGIQLGLPESIVMELAGITSYRTLKKYKGPAEQSVIEQWLDKMEDNMSLMRKAQ